MTDDGAARRPAIVVGIDVGGTKTNATAIDETGTFLIDRMVETPSCVTDGPDAAIAAIDAAVVLALGAAGAERTMVRAIGLDTPGPATADGVISVRGATNFSDPVWWGFDIRTAVEEHLGLPVVYSNDANAAALYAHNRYFAGDALRRSSVSAIVGTGLGGGVVESGHIVKGATGMGGEFGHIHIPLDGILEPDQPSPTCNCGFTNDAESVASLAAITRNLLPYWLGRYPDHPLAATPLAAAAKAVRSYGEQRDEMALRIFGQQADAIGRLFTIAANFTDPHGYFVGGGVTESDPSFRDWFLNRVQAATTLRAEQAAIARFAIVADLDMAGARGSALAALAAIQPYG